MRFLPFFVSALLSVTACGSSDGGDDDDAPAAVAGADLVGTWRSACHVSDPKAAVKKYDITTQTYTAATVTAAVDTHSDDKCTKLTTSIAVEATYTTSVVATPAGATGLDITITKFTRSPTSAAEVDTLNGKAEGSTVVCGGGWVLNQPKTMTKASCAGSTAALALFDTVYTIYQVTGTTLKEGDPDDDGSAADGSSAAKRATAFDPDTATKI